MKHLLVWKHRSGRTGQLIGSPAKIDAEIERRRAVKGGRLTRYELTKIPLGKKS